MTNISKLTIRQIQKELKDIKSPKIGKSGGRKVTIQGKEYSLNQVVMAVKRHLDKDFRDFEAATGLIRKIKELDQGKALQHSLKNQPFKKLRLLIHQKIGNLLFLLQHGKNRGKILQELAGKLPETKVKERDKRSPSKNTPSETKKPPEKEPKKVVSEPPKTQLLAKFDRVKGPKKRPPSEKTSGNTKQKTEATLTPAEEVNPPLEPQEKISAPLEMIDLGEKPAQEKIAIVKAEELMGPPIIVKLEYTPPLAPKAPSTPTTPVSKTQAPATPTTPKPGFNLSTFNIAYRSVFTDAEVVDPLKFTKKEDQQRASTTDKGLKKIFSDQTPSNEEFVKARQALIDFGKHITRTQQQKRLSLLMDQAVKNELFAQIREGKVDEKRFDYTYDANQGVVLLSFKKAPAPSPAKATPKRKK